MGMKDDCLYYRLISPHYEHMDIVSLSRFATRKLNRAGQSRLVTINAAIRTKPADMQGQTLHPHSCAALQPSAYKNQESLEHFRGKIRKDNLVSLAFLACLRGPENAQIG